LGRRPPARKVCCRAPPEEDLGFTRRCQCGPCDLDGLCDSLRDLDPRLFGVVLPFKCERKNGLRTFVEDVEAIARFLFGPDRLTLEFSIRATRGGGPRYRLFGRKPLYRWGDALEWARALL
jgi:hypothetical protein